MNGNNTKKPLKQGKNPCIVQAYERANRVLKTIIPEDLVKVSTQILKREHPRKPDVEQQFCWISQEYFDKALHMYDKYACMENTSTLFQVDPFVRFSIPKLARWFCVDMLPYTAYNGSEHVLRTGDTTFMRYQFKRGVSTTQERERFNMRHAASWLNLVLTSGTSKIAYYHTSLSVGNRSIFFDENIFDLSDYNEAPEYLQYPFGSRYRLSPLALMIGWYIYNELLNRYQAALLKDHHFACGDFLRFSGYWYILVTDLKRSQLKWSVTSGSTGELLNGSELEYNYQFDEFPNKPEHQVRRMSTDA
jgi:hypothetical protein|nr:MAG TPA: hypothetical protein [Caudoviricetes sp.]